MNKCLKITLQIEVKDGMLQNFIQKNAKKYNIEGTVQAIDKHTVKIIICGSGEEMDEFVDSLYKGYKDIKPSVIEVEPFLKDKDYRGVFRLIE
jgi:acylphosphatase